jgi:hypothetical protein
MADEKPVTVHFNYLKSPFFRVIHVDGGIGGPTPGGRGIHLALFSERPAIPQHIEQHVSPDGTLGAEVPASTEGKRGIVRELEVDAMMDLPTARILLKWLAEAISKLEKLQSSSDNGGVA